MEERVLDGNWQAPLLSGGSEVREEIDIKDFTKVEEVRETDALLLSDSFYDGRAAKITIGNLRKSLSGDLSGGAEGFATTQEVKKELEQMLRSPEDGEDGDILVKSGTAVKCRKGGSGSRSYTPQVVDEAATPHKVGGIAAGTTAQALAGKSFSEIIDDLLFETIYPTMTAPTLSLSISPSNRIYEAGSKLSLKLTANFNRGSITLGSKFQDYRSGVVRKYIFNGKTENAGADLPLSLVLGKEKVNYYAEAEYEAGPQPLDSKGNPWGTPLSSGKLRLGIVSIEGSYPIFATTIAITSFSKQPLQGLQSIFSAELNLCAETSAHKQAFRLPVEMKTLKRMELMNTLSGKYEPIDLNSFSKTEVIVPINGVSVDYFHYEHNGSNRGNVKLKLLF